MSPPETAAGPQTFERRVRFNRVSYEHDERTPDGQVVRVTRTGRVGDLIVLGPQEHARLQAAGALMPAGATVKDVDDERDARLSACRDQRRTIPAHGGGW